MQKRVLLIIFLLLSTFAFAQNGDLYSDLEDVTFSAKAGITPDSIFYVVETFFENFGGADATKAIDIKEEKIAEMKQMLLEGKTSEAKEALARADKYAIILENEVSPDIEKRVRQSSKSIQSEIELLDIDDDSMQNLLDVHLDKEEKIAKAAILSKEIKELCEKLSSIDPKEYERVCKTDSDAPKWQRDLDDKLTSDQQKEAKEFFAILSQCFENPKECRCEDISVDSFAKKCSVMAPLAAECEDGVEEACDKMDSMEDPSELLPDYLQDVMREVEDKFSDDEFDRRMPRECIKEGALTKASCMKVMFKLNAPKECQDALESGEIDISDEREARKLCEKIMFKHEAPKECVEAGFDNFRDCEKLMFELDAPKECIDAGIDGSGRDDWRKCEIIRFKYEVPKECLDAGLDGSGRDDWDKCDAIRFELEAAPECIEAGITGDDPERWDKCSKIQFKLNSPKECFDAGLDGTGRNDWDKCNKITFLLDAPKICHQFVGERDPWKACAPLQFQLDSPKECLDAGLDGSGRDDWHECNKITFLLDAPKECHKFVDDRDPWKSCQPLQFQLDAPKECLDAGIDGTGRDDWDKCDAIRFELDAPECVESGIDPNDRDRWDKCQAFRFILDSPKECLDAGLDGTGRNDWDKCNAIRFEIERPEECRHVDSKQRDPWKECNKIIDNLDNDQDYVPPIQAAPIFEEFKGCSSSEQEICDGTECKCISYEDFEEYYQEEEQRDIVEPIIEDVPADPTVIEEIEEEIHEDEPLEVEEKKSADIVTGRAVGIFEESKLVEFLKKFLGM